MAFFSSEKLKPQSIELDLSVPDSNSDQIRARLDRIRDNYDRLREIFTELEDQIESDDRLKAINETLDEDALAASIEQKSKRRWRGKLGDGARHKRAAKARQPGKPR